MYTCSNSPSSEALDISSNLKSAKNKEKMDNLDQANAEIDRLRKLNEKIGGELQGKRCACEYTEYVHVCKGREGNP